MKNIFNETLKAGCILINTETKKIGLIYRDVHDDYEFPKGHLEKNETLVLFVKPLKKPKEIL